MTSLKAMLDENAASVCSMSAIGLEAVTGHRVASFDKPTLVRSASALRKALKRVEDEIARRP